jgi:hypothetical protein
MIGTSIVFSVSPGRKGQRLLHRRGVVLTACRVPSTVLYFTVTGSCSAPVSFTTNVASFVPLSPSATSRC